MLSILYFLLAIFGLSFLIFIHELGHYWMARRNKMRVEVFSIGFGQPIYKWQRGETRWQIGLLPFGGYVKIAGMDSSGDQEPYSHPQGFFSKTPWQRIQVALMGPIVNILAAFVFFTALWIGGGREKSFSETTPLIGWLDPSSELYQAGVRPGDEIVSYNDIPLKSSRDHLYIPMTSPRHIVVKGYKIDYKNHEKRPFALGINTYPHPASLKKDVITTGVLQPASYLFYSLKPDGSDNLLAQGSPLKGSGLAYGDRVVWVDGELIFSAEQLNHVLNDNRLLVTIEREGQLLLRRVPRISVRELKLDHNFKEELIDWQFEAQLDQLNFRELYAFPYNLTNDCVVEDVARFIDQEFDQEAFPEILYSPMEEPLRPKDRILAVQGQKVTRSYELLKLIQQRKALLIVERNAKPLESLTPKDAYNNFNQDLDWKGLETLTQSIGTSHPLNSYGNLKLLGPVVPKTRSELTLSKDEQAIAAANLIESRKKIAAMEDQERRTLALQMLESHERQLLLGLPIQDQPIKYNPNPVTLMGEVLNEIWRTFSALFTGNLNVKWISGPIGIVQMVHDHSLVSWKEAVFWLGAISLNLGVFNLLPIPVLDGGTIVLCLFEWVTKRRLSPKVLEKIFIPFAMLLILLFIYVSYNDIARLLQKMWM